MKKQLFSMMLTLMMCLGVISSMPMTASAADSDESAYSTVFDETRQKIQDGGYIIGGDSYPSSDIADCSYTLYDIDGNGVNELIFKTEGGTAVIYTLYQGQPVLVAEWGGYRDYFNGINELGYMYGGGSSSAFSGGTRYYRMADDGSGGELVAEIDYEYSQDGKVTYTVKTPGGTKTMSEAEAMEYKKTITAPDMNLDGWKILTDSSGASGQSTQNAGAFDAYRSLLESNQSGIIGYNWFLDQSKSVQTNSGRVAIADICGDSTPELLFMTRNKGDASSGYSAGLRIYGYDGQQRLLLSLDDLDINYSSGAIYGVFTTKDKGIYVYRSVKGYDWGEYALTRYALDGQKLTQESKLEYAAYSEQSSYTYKRDGKQIQESAYDTAVKDILNQLDTVLLQSRFWSEPYWEDISRKDEITSSLTDAVKYLSGQMQAQPTASAVVLDGKKVSFDAYNIGGNNYFKLRDLAYALSGTKKQFNVGWDGANNAISLTSGKAYTVVGGEISSKGSGAKTPTATTAKIYLDGKVISLTAYTIDGNNYFKLRDIGEVFDFGVEWDAANNTIVIDTSMAYTAD